MSRSIEKGQLYRDLDRYMANRDRRLRVTGVGDTRAECLIEHDLGGTVGRTTHIQLKALATPSKYELLEEAETLGADPRYAALLSAMAKVHGAGSAATPLDYANAAWDALGLAQQETARVAPEQP
ncbi:DUF6354 family protein [Streptomyces sp. MP131-18]|uniref:DUF6354 family protein n=1 Tax=Streptomyces sp. MP131-18 TaxID=1857892 RepID=UPI00097C9AEB|nr:DUF6354 family protein [Streptomyces sp. MP131-18]ONK13240.1 hypothetical protein STBA_40030 [Streptomyces sp. MP131-18]